MPGHAQDQKRTPRLETPSPTRQDHPGAGPAPAYPLLRLQRSAGNQAIQRLLQGKLETGQPGDAYEAEADRIAGQVLRMAEPPGAPPPGGASTSGLYPADLPSSVLDTLSRPGRPLDSTARAFMEPRFGYDFSGVRLHTDTQAGESAQDINARAYTVGQDVVFGLGRYSAHTAEGKHLLAHELTHVVQQTGALHRAPDDAAGGEKNSDLTAPVPKSARIRDVIDFYLRIARPGVIQLYFIVDKNKLVIYDQKGAEQKTFTVQRPGLIDVTGYYIGSPFYYPGWGWIMEKPDGKLTALGAPKDWLAEARKGSKKGKVLADLNDELVLPNWLKEEDSESFRTLVGRNLVGMAILNPAPPVPAQKEGPLLNFDLPDWFKQLKGKVGHVIAEERQANPNNPNLPDKIAYYASNKVQAQRGSDAWTIQVNKAKRAAFLTIQKKSWDDAADKDAYAKEIAVQLLTKVKLIVDEAALKKQEEKEITEIDSAGPKKKGSRWAWAIRLRKQIEALLIVQKAVDPTATDFPNRLNITIQTVDEEEHAYLVISIYKTNPKADSPTIPDLISGALPEPLTEKDTAEAWAPLVRKATAALRNAGASPDATKTPTGEKPPEEKKLPSPPDPNAPLGPETILPAYPASIFARDLNPDLTTVPTASNEFRMNLDTAAIHGSNTLTLTSIHYAMTLIYGWKVYPLPKELVDEKQKLNGALKESDEARAAFAKKTSEYAKDHYHDLGTPLDEYSPDLDLEQSVDMEKLGLGDFMVVGLAWPRYPDDWNVKRATSLAAYPFTVRPAEELAKAVVNEDLDVIAALKKQQAEAKDLDKAKELGDQIKDMEEAEKESVWKRAGKSLADTRILLTKARELKAFIADDYKQKIPFRGDATHNPFLVRLKEFDRQLVAVYFLMRRAFDKRYDDLTGITEYIKILEQQEDQLSRLLTRAEDIRENSKLQKGSPLYRTVAALVKKEDGNVIPLTLVVARHEDTNVSKSHYRMMIFDLTFDAPKKEDMIYVGEQQLSDTPTSDDSSEYSGEPVYEPAVNTEEQAIADAFEKFGEKNKYGHGLIVYRVPKLGITNGSAVSRTPWTDYLEQAIAFVGIALLIAGTVMTDGLLGPAAVAAIETLGIATAVAGAYFAARHISERIEKGTFALDASFGMDVVAIIGAFVPMLGKTGKWLASADETLQVAQKFEQIERIDKLIFIYGLVDLPGNVILVSLKIREDVEAVKNLHLKDPDQEKELLDQITFEAIQSGAMLAIAASSKVKEISEHYQSRVENSPYQSLRERGVLDVNGNPTEKAPPIFKNAKVEPGKIPERAQQGQVAHKEAEVLPLGKHPSAEPGHEFTVTKRGRIIRCSEYCTELRLKFSEILREDPSVNAELTELETRAAAAAKANDQKAAEQVAADASAFEARIGKIDELRKRLFGGSQSEWEDEIEAAVDNGETPNVTGGPKSGRRIGGKKLLKPRRLLDVPDVMTEEELAMGKGGFTKAMERLGGAMGKALSELKELRPHAEALKEELMGGKTAEEIGKEGMLKLYKKMQRKLWERVRNDPVAKKFLQDHGLPLGESGAPLAKLGPKGTEVDAKLGAITDQERRVSLDHIEEKAQGDNWKRALDADNLELMFQNANSWKEIVQAKFGLRDKPEE